MQQQQAHDIRTYQAGGAGDEDRWLLFIDGGNVRRKWEWAVGSQISQLALTTTGNRLAFAQPSLCEGGSMWNEVFIVKMALMSNVPYVRSTFDYKRKL